MATVTQDEATWSTRLPTDVVRDWAFVGASFWLLAGLHLDGWAHAHRPGLESFFTPWHGILYSGFGVLALVALYTWITHGRVMPAGYTLTGVGVLLFLVGGAGDMLWHTFLGIEVNVEALLSPTHLALATGLALMVAGPLRAATRASVPAILSAGLLLSVFTFFTQYIQPGGRPWPLSGNAPVDETFRVASVTPDYPIFPGGIPTTELANILGIAGILLMTAFVVGLALWLVRHFTLPFGTFALVLSLDGALLALMRDTIWWLPVALVGGIAMDWLVIAFKPRLGGWRETAFAGAAPLALWSAYFAVLAAVGGLWWSANMWAGAIALSALAGVSLSLVTRAVQPAQA